MESRNSNSTLTRKKVLGTIFLTIFSLAFIFSCMHKILPVGRVILGTFGIMSYPMFLLLILISLASVLGLSYTRSQKATTYFCIALLSVLLFIQAIATFKPLNTVINFSTLKSYLSLSYTSKITFLGSCGSLVCGLISILLGAMGSIVIFVITATLFIGLFIDYQFYGKYEQPHVKKLKTRAMREKVQKSDKKRTSDQKPVYSFGESNSDDVVGEITVTENELNTNVSIYDSSPSYSQSEVVGEITNDDLSDDYNEPLQASYGESMAQTKNEFSSEFYQNQTYPGIEIGDKDEDRRSFMNATFGTTANQNMQSSNNFENQTNNGYQTSYNFPSNDSSDENEGISFTTSDEPTFDLGFNFEDSSADDEISRILNSSEDDIESEVKQDVFGNNTSPNLNFGENQNPRTTQRTSFGYDFSNEQKQNQQPSQNFGYAQQSNSVPHEPEKPKITISSTHPIGPEPVIPQKQPTFAGFGNTSVQTGFTGLRYNPPPLSLLRQPKADTGDYSEEQNRKSRQLEQVLEAFNVPAKVQNIVRGPKITRYELSVPLGVSVKKIPSYEDDIAAALAAKTIVIKAPIPGSPYVGIELENDTFTSVYERELLESAEFQNFKDPLAVAIGKDISGEIIVKSLTKMVHLLIAGSTGSGKSVFMHNIILSLIYKHSPDDLRLIMIDPKKVEFNIYNGIPHLLTPEVVSGPEKAINAFKWCVKEMERRYDLMSKAGHKNIEPYNKSELVKAGQFEKFPYIVIVVDELAEIMAVNKKDVELCIQRLTQLARACGMHLIVATQRPSVDIITGVIKNNIPSRIAFSLQSGIDSKTILNAVGAEKLLGQGDMIFAPTGTSATPRLQAAYASDDEINSVIEYVKRNNVSNFDETVDNIINSEQPTTTDEVASGGFVDAPLPKGNLDPYFKTAVKLVFANKGASVSYLQRRLSIGYSRAAKIIDQMEDKGYVGPPTGAKLRQILVTPEQFREDFDEDIQSIE